MGLIVAHIAPVAFHDLIVPGRVFLTYSTLTVEPVNGDKLLLAAYNAGRISPPDQRNHPGLRA